MVTEGVTRRLKAVREQFCELAKQDQTLSGIDVDKYVIPGVPVRQTYDSDSSAWFPYLHHQTALRVVEKDENGVKVEAKLQQFISSYKGMMAIRRALNPFLDAASQYTSLTLLELGAVELNVKKPRELASHNHSPVYVDNRFLITESKHKGAIASFMAEMMDHEIYSDINMIVGGETAGMSPAERLAQLVNLPYFYVRKKTERGKSAVVGNPNKINPPALLVEDLVTDAGSKLIFVDGMRAERAFCNTIAVIFDRLQGGREVLLKDRNCELYALTDLRQTRDVAVEKGYMTFDDDTAIDEYLKNPRKWNLDHGFDWYEKDVIVEKAPVKPLATA